MILHSYFRSSAAYRVRIALAWKGLAPEVVPVHLTRGGGEQHSPEHLARNPQGLVPVLELDDGTFLPQSLAIVEYLEETHPEPPLLPRRAVERARVRSLALHVACEIHPLNNLRVLAYLTGTLGITQEQRLAWYRHWVETGLDALESRLARESATGRFCHGDAPTLADVCLVPQIYNARRFGSDPARWPTAARVEAACLELEAFDRARPEVQRDAE
jgi:maleylacetoacetate isomerase